MSDFITFKGQDSGQKIIKNINNLADLFAKKQGKPIKIMHVCGTHEYTIANHGLRTLLSSNLQVIAGPGCPVCVCPPKDILAAMELVKKESLILTSFGDMMRVPINNTCINDLSMAGHDVRIVYGPNDAVEIARNNPKKQVVFFSVGFETTTPLIAFEIQNNPPENFSTIISNRLVPPAMDVLMASPDNELQGFILPGHVSAIIGVDAYRPLFEKYRTPMVIAGFEIQDVLISLYRILVALKEGEPKLENTYTRVVKEEGNIKAKAILKECFDIADSNWRGVGIIPKSGYILNEKYERYDALKKYNVPIPQIDETPKGCICDKIILGKSIPEDCPMFGSRCIPENPYGSCMVSHEGTCRIAHMFQEND